MDEAFLARARAVVPGGSMTRSKAVFERYASSCSGATITDINGNELIDTLAALGAATLGYPADVCSLPFEEEVYASEAVLRHVSPWASWCRFVKSGSESTHAAVRIARHATGRQTIVRCVDSYHGWFDWSSDTPGTLRRGLPTESDVAAVFIEPHRFARESVGWLKDVQWWCIQNGALLVFDSMVFGGRWALGGMSEFYGVIPDLECFGKGIGGGESVAFVVGTQSTYASGDIPSGTYTGGRRGLLSVMEAIDVYTSHQIIARLRELGQRLHAGFTRVIPAELGTVEGFPVCFKINYRDPAYGPRMTQEMLTRGVILHPLPILVMATHTEQQIDQVIAAAEASSAAVLA